MSLIRLWGLGILVLLCFPVVFSQTNTTAGFTLEFDVNFSTTTPQKTLSEVVGLENLFPTSSNISTNSVVFDLEVATQNYSRPTKLSIFDASFDAQSVLCNSSLSTSSNKGCSFSYDDAFISSPQYLGYRICNDLGQCSTPVEPFDFVQLEQSEWIDAGFKFTLESSFMEAIQPEGVEYVSPTPRDDFRKVNLENFTIRFYDGGEDFDSCSVVVNGTSYSMDYDGDFCEYTYTLPQNTSFERLWFQASYNINSQESFLENRSVMTYPPKGSTVEVPGFGVGSFLTFLVVFLSSFVIVPKPARKNKKGLGAVVAMSLLIVVGVSSVVSFQVWQTSYFSDLFTKAEGSSNNAASGLDIVLAKNSGTDIEIYVRNPSSTYGVVNQIDINGRPCSLSGSDVLGEETTSIVDVSGCSFPFEKRVEIVMITDSGLLESYQILR